MLPLQSPTSATLVMPLPRSPAGPRLAQLIHDSLTLSESRQWSFCRLRKSHFGPENHACALSARSKRARDKRLNRMAQTAQTRREVCFYERESYNHHLFRRAERLGNGKRVIDELIDIRRAARSLSVGRRKLKPQTGVSYIRHAILSTRAISAKAGIGLVPLRNLQGNHRGCSRASASYCVYDGNMSMRLTCRRRKLWIT